MQQAAIASPPDGGIDAAAVEGASQPDSFEAIAADAVNDPRHAAAAFEAFAAAHPEGEYAAESLLEAAQLDEERLGRPDLALTLYERLLTRYPDDRLALRARARRDFLAAALRTGAAPLAEYQEILQRYQTRPHEESVARMQRLCDAHPDFALADRALLWLAHASAEAGHAEDAVRRYADIEQRFAGTPIAREAALAGAETLMASGHLFAARARYAALAETADATPVGDAAREGLARTRTLILRRCALVIALALLVVFLAMALRIAGRRAFARPPIELIFYVPIAGLFALASLAAGPAARRAVLVLAGGGALLTWAASAAGRALLGDGARPRRRRLFVAATALAALAMIYATVDLLGLVDTITETIASGPDR